MRITSNPGPKSDTYRSESVTKPAKGTKELAVHRAALTFKSLSSPDARLQLKILSPASAARSTVLSSIIDRDRCYGDGRGPLLDFKCAKSLELLLATTGEAMRQEVLCDIGKLVSHAAERSDFLTFFRAIESTGFEVKTLVLGWREVCHGARPEARTNIRRLIRALGAKERKAMLALLSDSSGESLRDAVAVHLELHDYIAADALLRRCEGANTGLAQMRILTEAIQLCADDAQHAEFAADLCGRLVDSPCVYVRREAIKHLPREKTPPAQYARALLEACRDSDGWVIKAGGEKMLAHLIAVCEERSQKTEGHGSAVTHEMLTFLSLRSLAPHAQGLLDVFRRLYPQEWAAMDAKGFQADDPVHAALAYLRMLEKPHTFQLLSNDDFHFRNMRTLGPKTRYVYNDARAAAEVHFLAYDAHLLYHDVIAPAQLRAKELGRPLMLVANFTYGGTAVTALPLRALRESGVQIVGTKQGSSEAHEDRNALNYNLFNEEQIRYIVREQPLVVVVDGSANRSQPDAFIGYHNFVTLLNQSIGLSRRPNSSLKLNYWKEETLAEMMKRAPRGGHPRQNVEVFHTSLPLGRREGFRGPHYPLNFLHRWDQIKGPAFVCVQVATDGCLLTHRQDAATRMVDKLYGLIYHRPAYFDDSPQAQAAHVYLNKRGVGVKPLAVHTEARAFYKKLDKL